MTLSICLNDFKMLKYTLKIYFGSQVHLVVRKHEQRYVSSTITFKLMKQKHNNTNIGPGRQYCTCPCLIWFKSKSISAFLYSAPDKPHIHVKYAYIFADTDRKVFELVSNTVRDCFKSSTYSPYRHLHGCQSSMEDQTKWFPPYMLYSKTNNQVP